LNNGVTSIYSKKTDKDEKRSLNSDIFSLSKFALAP
jgi:hypothetical protein